MVLFGRNAAPCSPGISLMWASLEDWGEVGEKSQIFSCEQSKCGSGLMYAQIRNFAVDHRTPRSTLTS